MKRTHFFLLILFHSLLVPAQTVSPEANPQDPRLLLDQAAPFYVYDAQTTKPWHLTYSYRILGDDGKPSGEGKVEFWWSAQTKRITWTKSGTVSSEWHTADGKTLTAATGPGISGMEHRLSSAVLFTYPKSQDYETGDSHLKLATLKVPSGNILCAAVVPARFEANFKGDSLSGASTAYCFGREVNILVLTLMNHTISNIYSSVEKFQNHPVARHIDIAYVGKKRIEAEMQDYQEVAADDSAFTPSPDAKEFRPETTTITVPILSVPIPAGSDSGPVYISAGIAMGMLIKQVSPIYPLDAKAAHISGTVVIQAQIGKDGSIKNAKIVSSPNSSLSAAALDAVRQWQYRPYLLNGQPVAVDTTINVIFTL